VCCMFEGSLCAVCLSAAFVLYDSPPCQARLEVRSTISFVAFGSMVVPNLLAL
jgi:hypothetical protein